MQPRVEEVGLGDALAVGVNVIGPVAGLVLFRQLEAVINADSPQAEF